VYLRGWHEFGFIFWLGLIFLSGASLAADYVVLPVYLKKRGGSSQASWAAALGLIVGAFFSLPGLLLGPLAAVFLVEWLQKRDVNRAWQAAWHTVVGFFLTAAAKFITLLAMLGWYLAF
jgi:uncharacterized protein YqgC (DUF456 family)